MNNRVKSAPAPSSGAVVWLVAAFVVFWLAIGAAIVGLLLDL